MMKEWADNKGMKLLLLGGTADGRILAERLHQHNISVIYSVAGLVRVPTVECNVVSGGFTQFGGLECFIKQNKIDAILDVTHPYAEKMSTKAINVAKVCRIPYWRFHRKEWQPQAGDNWVLLNNWDEALSFLSTKQSILLTAGQLNQSFIDSLYELSIAQLSDLSPEIQPRQLLRTAVKPKAMLPPTMEWIKAIGPFTYGDELALMEYYNVDVLVTKNSGGDSTIAKLAAARDLDILVLMLKRPELPSATQVFYSRDECEQFVLGVCNAL